MIKLEETELSIVNIDEEDPSFYVAFLLEKARAAQFDAAAFMDGLGHIDDNGKEDEEVDVEISELLYKWGVLEMFDKSEVEELAEEHAIDPTDLHASLYEVYVTDQMS